MVKAENRHTDSEWNEMKKSLGDKAYEAKGNKDDPYTQNNFKRAVEAYRKETRETNDKVTNRLLGWLLADDLGVKKLFNFEKI